ncbi:MAG TPA: ATP-dependent 6-phosphofructokinase, partial [Desulfatiglandales bacterium]|nr:ATP-dependent 6-phosphofructokinase [Desulfatiglandales bacterium]
MEQAKDFTIQRLGDCTVPSPMSGIRFTKDDEHVLLHSDLNEIKKHLDTGIEPPRFEAAGPREKIFFDPATLNCGIVTCGGLCPGLNDVIRSVVLSLHHHYGVRTIYGFPYGYEGLEPKFGHQPIMLTPQVVSQIDEMGGTILGSSRGDQDVPVMVDTLERMGVGILFCIGGDGTQRGALAISEEASRRGFKLSVIGVPKTIDNDISYVQMTFGFETAVSEAKRATSAAYAEAAGARNGIGLVKLMGRDSGFIAAFSALVDNEVNFCLIPEVPFTLDGFFSALRKRFEQSGYAVIVVAEGAGQELFEA